jgi:hypothetical protein
MRRLLWVVPVAFFFLNPSFACGPSEPQYEYGAAEMRAAVEGAWSFTILPDGSTTPLQLVVRIDQAAAAPGTGTTARAPGHSFVRAAYACGGRTLVKSADACTDWSEMPLDVKFVSGDASFASAAMSGRFLINGTQFQVWSTDLSLVLGDFKISSQLSPDGTLVNPRVDPTGKPGSLTIVTRL